MFLFLLCLTIVLIVAGIVVTYRRTGDVFHPVMIIFPMFGFLYGWMPLKLYISEILSGFFYPEQLWFAQGINLLGIAAFLLGALSVGHSVAVAQNVSTLVPGLTEQVERRLLLCSAITGLLGLTAWTIAIRNVGGIADAFSHPYSGGWDDSGYIRDGSLVMFSAVVLATAVLVRGRRKMTALTLVIAFILPWIIQALFTSRRGPSFMICAVLVLAWFLYRRTRPPLAAVLICSLLFGYGILLLVVNRNKIYWGSDFAITTNVDSYIKTNDGSNEYIYGAGSILDAYYSNRYYWGRRYLAQIIVRPIPSALWPDKYEDFGVGSLTKNAGNSTTFASTLGWSVPPGAAPGIVADLWVEMSWFAIPALWLAGRFASWTWLRAITRESFWISEYCICAALAIYFVMQTMEAVIFRFLLLSMPMLVAWSWANYSGTRIRHIGSAPGEWLNASRRV